MAAANVDGSGPGQRKPSLIFDSLKLLSRRTWRHYPYPQSPPGWIEQGEDVPSSEHLCQVEVQSCLGAEGRLTWEG